MAAKATPKPRPVTINKRSGWALDLDDNFQPVAQDKATFVRVLFDDGVSVLYKLLDSEANP
jgi:hypothetical protein